MYDKILYESDDNTLKADSEKCILLVNTKASEYNESEFNIFMSYLIAFWSYVKTNNLKYYILIDVRSFGVSMLPITFYKQLIKKLNTLNDIMQNHLHCMCILCSKNSFVDNIFSVLFSLYTPKRPFSIVYNEEEIDNFYSKNRL